MHHLAVAAIVITCLLSRTHCVSGMDFYVSPTGNDSDPGTEAQPFATLEMARDAVRVCKESGQLDADGVTIWLRGGDYLRSTPLELTSADSGSAQTAIVWKAYPGEQARLIGGRSLEGFQPVSDRDVLQRFAEAAREHVLEIDLHALGLREFGELKSRGFSRPATVAHCELFVAGVPMTLARWPNDGQWAQIEGFPLARAQDDGHGGKIGTLEDGFFYGGDRPRRWKDTSNVWVHGYWSWDWANSYEQVAKIDLDQRLVTTHAPYGLYGFRTGQRFYFLNVLEELDQPGEWYLDRAAGKLYFWPPANSPADAPVILSLLGEPFLRLTDASHITVQGLIFEAARSNGVEIKGGTNNSLTGCTLRDLGNWGVRVEGGTDHRVVSCDIMDTGDGGVVVSGGDRQTLTAAHHVVENCHFQRQGRWSKCYVPAVLVSGVGIRVAHNLIHDHPHCAILFGGNEHLIELNEIHHIALETGDVGAIYTGRDWTCRGNQLRHNLIHHTGGVGMGSMGVYMDDCVSGTEVIGNVFFKVHWAMFIGGGRDHRVENNIFVDCDPAVRIDGRGLDKSPVWFNMVYGYMKENLDAMPQELYRMRYPAIKNLDRYYATRDGVPPEDNVIARNICVGKWLEIGWHAQESWLKLEENFVGEDPGFLAPDKLDFRLKPDAAPLQQGFQNIPCDQIGLQIDEFRKTIPSRTSQ